jgi:hypothetical protein
LVGKNNVFYELYPVKGKGESVIEVDWSGSSSGWVLSRDGSRVAYLEQEGTTSLIKILTLASGAVHGIPVNGRWNVQSLAWAADANSFFCANSGSGKDGLFHVDFQGTIRALLEPRQAGEWLGNPIPSPDGRHLAFQNIGVSSDYWLLQGF